MHFWPIPADVDAAGPGTLEQQVSRAALADMEPPATCGYLNLNEQKCTAVNIQFLGRTGHIPHTPHVAGGCPIGRQSTTFPSSQKVLGSAEV